MHVTGEISLGSISIVVTLIGIAIGLGLQFGTMPLSPRFFLVLVLHQFVLLADESALALRADTGHVDPVAGHVTVGTPAVLLPLGLEQRHRTERCFICHASDVNSKSLSVLVWRNDLFA